MRIGMDGLNYDQLWFMPIARMLKRIIFLLVFFTQTIYVSYAAGSNKDHQPPGPNAGSQAQINALLHQAKITSQVDSIDYFLQQALAVAKKENLESSFLDIFLTGGELYNDRSLYDFSLENYFKALRIYESNSDSLGTAKVMDKIGKVYLITRTNDMDESFRFFSDAYSIYQALNDSGGVMSSINGLGATYQKRGDYTKALSYYQTALLEAPRKGKEKEKCVIFGNIGSTFMLEGKLDSAVIYLQNALALKKKYSADGSIAHTLNDLSLLMLKLNRPAESIKYAQEAIKYAKTGNNADQLKYGYLNSSYGNRAQRNFREAYFDLLKFGHLNDSLFGLKKEQQFQELQIKYESEKKDNAISNLMREKEIADFRKKIYPIIGGLLLLIAIGLFNWQRMRAKKNKELLEKEKEVDRVKTSFFANISHEFRTPLTLILSPIQTMLESKPNPQQRDYLLTMNKSANRLLQLINQILDLSKLEAGQLKLELKSVDIIALLKGVTMSFQSLTESKNIRLHFVSNWNEKIVNCDADKLETVLINLVSNAVKNTDSGGSVTVEVVFSDDSKSFQIEVKDTGKGIEEEKIPFIFDRYFQGKANYSDLENPGTGIGLALTKQLIELQDGKIDVESEIGVGTRFTVQIPFYESAPSASKLGINHERTEERDIHRFPENETNTGNVLTKELENDNPILLVIEDNADVRKYLKNILIKDYQILEAKDGVEGVEMAQENIPDLIISDVMMPRMNGYEVCTKLKQDEKTSHIPVILLTAKSSAESRIAGLETQADMYLSKPFIPKELLVCIKNLIESRRRLRSRYNREVVLKPAEISINSVDEQFLNRLMAVLEKNYANADFTVEQLGKEVGMSRSQIHRKLHALTNESSSRFIRSFRLQKAMDMLQKNAGTISEISFLAGFNSPSYFNKCFLEQYGYTPSSAIEKHS